MDELNFVTAKNTGSESTSDIVTCNFYLLNRFASTWECIGNLIIGKWKDVIFTINGSM